jgi:hypothetical protein
MYEFWNEELILVGGIILFFSFRAIVDHGAIVTLMSRQRADPFTSMCLLVLASSISILSYYNEQRQLSSFAVFYGGSKKRSVSSSRSGVRGP